MPQRCTICLIRQGYQPGISAGPKSTVPVAVAVCAIGLCAALLRGCLVDCMLVAGARGVGCLLAIVLCMPVHYSLNAVYQKEFAGS